MGNGSTEIKSDDARKAAYSKSRRSMIAQDYEAFAYGAVEDLRLAMQGRSVSTSEAQPLLMLWAAVVRACPAYSIDDLVQEFCNAWCSDPVAAWSEFNGPRGLDYVRNTDLYPSRNRLRASFGIDAMEGVSWFRLCSDREWETRRKAEQRAHARRPAEAQMPAALRGTDAAREHARRLPRTEKVTSVCDDGRPRGAKPWNDVGVSRKTWYAWTLTQRIDAVAKAGLAMEWLERSHVTPKSKHVRRDSNGRALFW